MNETIFRRKAKYWREHVLGITQYELAKRLNVFPQTISSFETGRTFPGHLVLWYLELGMGEWLYGNKNTGDR